MAYECQPARGEVVVVIGPPLPETTSAATLDDRLRAALEAGLSLRDAAAVVAEATGLPRRQVYGRALELANP